MRLSNLDTICGRYGDDRNRDGGTRDRDAQGTRKVVVDHDADCAGGLSVEGLRLEGARAAPDQRDRAGQAASGSGEQASLVDVAVPVRMSGAEPLRGGGGAAAAVT